MSDYIIHTDDEMVFWRTREVFDWFIELLNDKSKAPKYGSQEILKMVREGIDPYASYDNGNTILYFAAISPHSDILEAMLQNGADANYTYKDSYSLLHYAGARSLTRNVRILAEAGANVQARNRYGETPLHYVTLHKGDADGARVLINHGAPLEARDNAGNTPSHYATSNPKCYDLLRRRGASVRAINNKGELPDLDINADHEFLRVSKSTPATIKETMNLVSLMPVENPKAIPEPRERLHELFRTLPHNDFLNRAHKKLLGTDRPLEVTTSLQELRARAGRNPGVGL